MNFGKTSQNATAAASVTGAVVTFADTIFTVATRKIVVSGALNVVADSAACIAVRNVDNVFVVIVMTDGIIYNDIAAAAVICHHRHWHHCTAAIAVLDEKDQGGGCGADDQQ